MNKIFEELEKRYPVKSQQAKFIGCHRQNLSQVKRSIIIRFKYMEELANKLGYKINIEKL